MATSSSAEFRRIVSGRTWLQSSLLPAFVCGLLNAVLLGVVLVSVWGLLWLLMESAVASPPADRGLLPLLETMNHAPCSWVGVPLQKVGWMSSTMSAAWLLISVICGSLIVRGVVRSFAESVVERHVSGAVLRLRQHVHRTAIRLEPSDLAGEQLRETNRLFQDTATSLESTASQWSLQTMMSGPELALAALLPLLANWRVALQTIIPVVLGRLLLQWESHRGDSSLRLLSDQATRGLGKLAESLRKTRIVNGFGMEQSEQQGLATHLTDHRERCRDVRRQQRIAAGIRQAILIAMVVVPSVLLVLHVLRGWHPALALLVGACLLIVDRRVSQLPQLQTLSSVGSECADEIAEYINRIPGVSQAPGARFFEPMSKTLTFNQVSWQSAQYPGLIKGLDLRIGLGERVALLSLNPIASYALASMVPRFIDPDLGQVLIDGRDIREATLESLRAEAIMVSGNDPLFNASVLDNITCGQSDISRQAAVEAAKLVHADQFVRTLPKGYETMLGEHGIALDVGQTFRLSLARALVREPALLVIEEPSVPLDGETKAMLDDTYQRIGDDRGIIFLPTRLSTVKRCSRIVLIHEGRVAVDGVHDQLVRGNELYRHWEYQRFNQFREDGDAVA